MYVTVKAAGHWQHPPLTGKASSQAQFRLRHTWKFSPCAALLVHMASQRSGVWIDLTTTWPYWWISGVSLVLRCPEATRAHNKDRQSHCLKNVVFHFLQQWNPVIKDLLEPSSLDSWWKLLTSMQRHVGTKLKHYRSAELGAMRCISRLPCRTG